MTTIEKIRAEITEKINHYEHFSSSNTAHGLEMALDILDKYETKLEPSEECDNDCEHCAYLECPKGGE